MCKNRLSERQKMNEASVVDQAACWAECLTKKAHKGAGDTVQGAMNRASKKACVPYQLFWKLRYRKPADLMASAYKNLEKAYEQECQRQEAKLRHELEIFEKVHGENAALQTDYLAAKAALENAKT